MSGKTQQLREAKIAYHRMLEAKERLKRGLPHLYGFPHYQWSREFFESRNKNQFLCAANQIGKSSSMIRKCIHWATEESLWPQLWPTRPKLFFYLYPDKNVATVEYKNKWVKEFLPRDEFKKDPKYGWKSVMQNSKIDSIEFNSGVTISFKTYSQDDQSLQASSVHVVACDEELPYHLYEELSRRRSAPAIKGYFMMVFTATLAQEFWRLCIEERGKYETFREAFKKQVSMFDCLKYEDGSPTLFTEEHIKEQIALCSSDAEVQRRIFGRFVNDSNKVFEGFSRARNVKPDHPLPSSWYIYTGIDLGSGGKKNHPAAICFVGVKPDYTEGRVFLGRRLDGIETTAGDVLNTYRQMRGNMRPVLQCYDWESRDFYTIACRLGESFVPAEKARSVGEGLLNTLFKHNMLSIYESDENWKLVHELENLKRSTSKENAFDDFADSLRYAISRIPWDFSGIDTSKTPVKITEEKEEPTNPRERFYKGLDQKPDEFDLVESDFDEANEAYEYYGYD